ACLKAGDTKSLVGYTLGDGVDVEGLVYRGGQNGAYYSDPDSLYPDVILSVGRDEPHILFCLYGEEAWGDFFGLKPGVDTLVDLRAIWGEPDVFEEFEGYSAIYFLNDKGYRLYVKLSDDTENAVVQSLIYKID
ncbi:MAG: hypothetical protein FWE80_10405, partial [Oscillospiraceae bacterium]|nr:hypothetical protein [Oscillospiraceae bacterium]